MKQKRRDRSLARIHANEGFYILPQWIIIPSKATLHYGAKDCFFLVLETFQSTTPFGIDFAKVTLIPQSGGGKQDFNTSLTFCGDFIRSFRNSGNNVRHTGKYHFLTFM